MNSILVPRLNGFCAWCAGRWDYILSKESMEGREFPETTILRFQEQGGRCSHAFEGTCFYLSTHLHCNALILITTGIPKMIIATFRDASSGKGQNSRDSDFDSDTEDDDIEVVESPVGWAYVGSHNFTPSAWGNLSGSAFNPILNVREQMGTMISYLLTFLLT